LVSGGSRGLRGDRLPRRMVTPLRGTVLRLLALAIVLTNGCTLFGPGEEETTTPDIGGSVTMAVSKPNSLDPSKGSNPAAVLILRQMCLPLVEAHPLTGELLPGAARSWEVADGGKQVTFRLREGLLFQDGTPVEAEDYVYSLSRFVDRETGSRFRFWLNRIPGYTAVSTGKSKTLSGVTAPDAETLVIRAARPFADLPAVLSHPSAGSAVPEEHADKKGFSNEPVCTGPYAVDGSQEEDGSVTLVRSEAYDATSEAYSLGGRGYLDSIRFHVADAEEGYQLLEEGEVDLTEVPVTDRFAEAQQTPGRLHSGPNGLVSYLGFPVKKGAFDNVLFRRALALAVNRRSVIEDLLASSRMMPEGFLPPTAGPASERSKCSETMKPTTDPEAAALALEASEESERALSFNIYFNEGEGHATWLSEVAGAWAEHLDVEAELDGREYRRYLDLLASGRHRGPFRLAWRVHYPSPEAFLAPIFRKGSPDNYMGYSSEEFQELLTDARSASDTEDRERLYGEAADVLCEDLPMVVMWFGMAHFAFADDLVSRSEQRVGIFGEPVLREIGRRS
jgi:oligopeptide transport system substrate-binding protein